MDLKEQEFIHYYLGRILNNVFDEKDILPFFILLRPYAFPKSPTLEIGNFIAHRERDRGDIHEYLQQNRDVADQDGFTNLDLSAPPIYTVREIGSSLNDVLNNLGFAQIPIDIVEDITLCLISLLQEVKFQSKRTGDLGSLFFAFNETEVFLIGALRLSTGDSQIIPVLTTPNKYLDWTPKVEEGMRNILAVSNTLTVIVRVDGRLTAQDIGQVYNVIKS